MIKLIIFDLDGVLVSSKRMHFEALNAALGDRAISWEEHVFKYDGLPTTRKLDMLGVPESEKKAIWDRKQAYSVKYVSQHTRADESMKKMFSDLKLRGFTLAVASNSIRDVTRLYLLRLGVLEFVDLYLSNQDVAVPKPNPEIYLRCMATFSVKPKDTLIIEDSYYGLKAAYDSGANVMQVHSPEEVTFKNIMKKVEGEVKEEKPKWVTEANVLVPMAGAGSRFEKAGYTFPKPLIDVNGKPMVQAVVDSLRIEGQYTYIVQEKHLHAYMLTSLLSHVTPNSHIVRTDGLTEGAACTTLLAKEIIDNDKMLIIANSDQIIEWDPLEVMYEFENGHSDALILTFESSHPQWSYARVEDGRVIDVAEKKVISNEATVGVYIWRHGSDYVKYAEQMIERNIRHNNEFYVAPVFNQAIVDGKKVVVRRVDAMHGLGTPELLERYLKIC